MCLPRSLKDCRPGVCARHSSQTPIGHTRLLSCRPYMPAAMLASGGCSNHCIQEASPRQHISPDSMNSARHPTPGCLQPAFEALPHPGAPPFAPQPVFSGPGASFQCPRVCWQGVGTCCDPEGGQCTSSMVREDKRVPAVGLTLQGAGAIRPHFPADAWGTCGHGPQRQVCPAWPCWWHHQGTSPSSRRGWHSSHPQS